jgi:hypothetical protein
MAAIAHDHQCLRDSLPLASHGVPSIAGRIVVSVPRLWTQTIETHRREVRDAVVDTTAALVAEHGLLSVRMSQIAEATGIGRA